jgi:hypothetical protein
MTPVCHDTTRAFARYIKDLQRRFGNWELAILGYLSGENALRGAVNLVGTSESEGIVAYLPQHAQYLSQLRRYDDSPIILMPMGLMAQCQ